MPGPDHIVHIDEELCDGCGLCLPSCHEGAIALVNGKARLVAEGLCDGLGACLGECPRGAIRLIPKEAPAAQPEPAAHGCPGSRIRQWTPQPAAPGTPVAPVAPAAESGTGSSLGHWPVKIRLVPPHAPFLEGADLVVTADCVPVALPGFHRDYLPGRVVLIGCPKFDSVEEYSLRFAGMFEQARVRRVTALVMEVPCCQGLPLAVLRGLEQAGCDLPVEKIVVGVDGEIRRREILRAGNAPAAR